MKRLIVGLTVAAMLAGLMVLPGRAWGMTCAPTCRRGEGGNRHVGASHL